MKIKTEWTLSKKLADDTFDVPFTASVPGCVQKDIIKKENIDLFYSTNVNILSGTEDNFWLYKTTVPKKANEDETLFFVAEGIDYSYDILLNDKLLLNGVGMYSTVKVELFDANAFVEFEEDFSQYLNQMIGFEAEITKVDKPQLTIRDPIFECRSCMRIYEMKHPLYEKEIREPAVCQECGGRSFKLLENESTYSMTQRIIVGKKNTKKK